MIDRDPLCILQVNTHSGYGGAAKVAWSLFQGFQQHEHHCLLAVGLKQSMDDNVIEIPNDSHRSSWSRFWLRTALSVERAKIRGNWRAHNCLTWMARPGWMVRKAIGVEDFDFPGTHHLLNILPEEPSIVHCHNLHGGYFDLRVLTQLSHRIPVILTLHDAWLLSGHCAHSFECERWESGCEQCPDLSIYPAMERDRTAYNWRRKRDIYARSRLHVATPSQWLMDKVQRSILAPGIVTARVIPNAVDLSIFHPSDQRKARGALGLPIGTKILLFVANGIRGNIWKDYKTMRTALTQVAERLDGRGVMFLALGEDAPPEHLGKARVQFVPYQKDPEVVARFYQAADVYIHAARADTFPNTVLEALACGTPVVATSVGGIPEQVDDGRTGFLTPPGGAEAMANRIEQLLQDDDLRHRFGYQAANVARSKFDLDRQVEDYLSWYYEILETWHKENYDHHIQHSKAIQGTY